MKKMILVFILLTMLLIWYYPHSVYYREHHMPHIQPAPGVNYREVTSLYHHARGPVITPTPCTAVNYHIITTAAEPVYVDTGNYLILTGCKKTPILIDRKYFGVAQDLWNYVKYAKPGYRKELFAYGIPTYPTDFYGTYRVLMYFRTFWYGFNTGADATDVLKGKHGVCVDYAAMWAAWFAANGLKVTAVDNNYLHHAYVIHDGMVFENYHPFEKRAFFYWKWHLASGGVIWRTEDVTLVYPYYMAFHAGYKIVRVTVPRLTYDITVDGKTTVLGRIDGINGYKIEKVGTRTIYYVKASNGYFTVNNRKYIGPFAAYMHLLPPAPVPSIMAYTSNGWTYYYMIYQHHATAAKWTSRNGRITGTYIIDGKTHTFSGTLIR